LLAVVELLTAANPLLDHTSPDLRAGKKGEKEGRSMEGRWKEKGDSMALNSHEGLEVGERTPFSMGFYSAMGPTVETFSNGNVVGLLPNTAQMPNSKFCQI
jgi:hypothetical protein